MYFKVGSRLRAAGPTAPRMGVLKWDDEGGNWGLEGGAGGVGIGLPRLPCERMALRNSADTGNKTKAFFVCVG